MKSNPDCQLKRKLYIAGFVVIFLLTVFAIITALNYIYVNRKIDNLSLTAEEKVSDFQTFYDTIIYDFPNINEVNNVYAIDFKEKYDFYCEKIVQTKTDFEFYCTMTAIIEDLASYHTGFCFPDYEGIKALNCYNLDTVLDNKNTKAYTTYWNDVIKENCEKYKDVSVAEFKYVDGKYVYDSKWSSEKYDDLQGYFITSIADNDVNRYVLDNLSIYKIQYDRSNNLAYRRVITLNESVGEKLKIVLENQHGERVERELCVSLEMEMVNTCYPEYEEADEMVGQNVYYYYDENDDILYLEINNFQNNEGEKIKEALDGIGSNTQIIIDLRDNYGGNPYYAKEYLYPFLYDETICFEQKWFVSSEKCNRELSKGVINQIMYETEMVEGGVVYKTSTEYKGNQEDYRNHIYYLVSKKTASAADEYIAMVKANELGTVIGTDTAGEGLGGSFIVDILENSGWVFTYYPCRAYGVDGENNGVFGTSPDIYIQQSVDRFIIQRTLEKEKKDIESYECRLEWDNVLIETIDIIEEK